MAIYTLHGTLTGTTSDRTPVASRSRLPRLLFAAGLLLTSCTPTLPFTGSTSSHSEPTFGPHQTLAVSAGPLTLFEAPALIDAPALGEAPTAPREETPARPTWQPPNLSTHPFPAQVERWRPRVQELLVEAYDEGRLQGKASILDDDFVLAVMERESRGSTAAMSGAGAMGLMQLIPSTYAEMMGIPQSRISEIPTQAYWDTDSNLRAGIRYLAYVLNDQNGNRYWALAAYNGGTTITRRWRVAGLDAVPPYGRYDETADYAQIVLRNYLSHRPDVQTYVPAPMPSSHIPGALAMLERVPSA